MVSDYHVRQLIGGSDIDELLPKLYATGIGPRESGSVNGCVIASPSYRYEDLGPAKIL